MGLQVQANASELAKDRKSDIAYVVGCGPTIDDLDMDKLAGKEIFALNAAISLFTDPKKFRRAHWFFRDGRAGPEIWPHVGRWQNPKFVTTLIGYRRLKDLAGIHKESHIAYLYPRETIRHERSVIEDTLQVLAQAGYRKVFLVGVDHRMRDGQPYAKAFSWKPCHWHNPKKPKPDPDLPLQAFVDGLAGVKDILPTRGFEVINTSPRYPEPLFPYLPFDEAVSI